MRIFQSYGLSPAYVPRAEQLMHQHEGFVDRMHALLYDRYNASHLLDPQGHDGVELFVACENANAAQKAWAEQHGLSRYASPDAILLAQIEKHQSEVFYNTGTVRFDDGFLKRLPSCVKRKIAWRAAPSGDFGAYDLVVNNFQGIRENYAAKGWATGEFFPSHDPALDDYAANDKRDIDILFIGGYTRHHVRRNAILKAVAELSQRYRVVFHLGGSRYAKLAESPLGFVGPLAKMRRPKSIRSIAEPPVFGRVLYHQLSRARIVVNAAIDMAGPDRGNMRCFEALGAACLMITDEGNYPPGMEDGKTMLVYRSVDELLSLIELHLGAETDAHIASAGYKMLRAEYSKKKQFARFLKLVR